MLQAEWQKGSDTYVHASMNTLDPNTNENVATCPAICIVYKP